MNKIIMRNAIEELEYQITRLSNEVVVDVLGFEKDPYSFIENSITSPLVLRAIIDYITIKNIGLNKKESRDQEKRSIIDILGSVSLSDTQNKIMISESSSEFVLLYIYIVELSD